MENDVTFNNEKQSSKSQKLDSNHDDFVFLQTKKFDLFVVVKSLCEFVECLKLV